LTPEVIKNLTEEQVELLLELGDLAKAELVLTEKIEEVRKQAEHVGWKESSNNTKAIHEDDEFDELISLKFIRDREIIRDKISTLMKTVSDAGLADLELIVRQQPNYGPKPGSKE